MRSHGPRVYGRSRARIRVGLAAGLADANPATGHGNAWASMLAELRRSNEVRLVRRGQADVWLASGHAAPPDRSPLLIQVFEAAWFDPVVRPLLHDEFVAAIDAATRSAVVAADGVITTSEAGRSQVISGYEQDPSRVWTVPLGVDRSVFRPGIEGGRQLIGAPYVLFVALLHPRKNYVAVRQAVADLAAAGLPHRLAVVGGLPPDPRAHEFERSALAELPGEPGRIAAFRDVPRSQLIALLAGADVLCLPSYFEGFGLPVLEAMACGTPVVVSDRGSLPEVVGDAGLIVSPDPDEVSRAVRRVIGEPHLAERLRAAGVERAGKFSWERTAAGWVQAIRRLAAA